MAPRSAEVFMRSGALLRKLKGFIENEIDILHQYNKDEAEMWKTSSSQAAHCRSGAGRLLQVASWRFA